MGRRPGASSTPMFRAKTGEAGGFAKRGGLSRPGAALGSGWQGRVHEHHSFASLQAAGQVATFYPLPSKARQQQEFRKAQRSPAETAPGAAAVPPVAKPAPEAAEPEKIEVVSVKAVPADANVRFVPEGEQPK